MIILDLSTVESGVRSIGGVDTVCQMHLEGLRHFGDRRSEYIVLAFNGVGDLARNGEIRTIAPNIELHWYNYDRRVGMTRLLPNVVLNEWLVRRYIKRFRPHVVHSHNPAWHIFQYAKERKVLTLHSYKKIGRTPTGILNGLLHEDLIQPQSLRAADVVFSVSKEIADLLKQATNRQAVCVPNPIGTAYARVERTLPDDRINLLLSSSVMPQKRTLDALKVLRSLRPHEANVHLYIAGRHFDGCAYYASLRDYVAKHGLTEHVHFTGLLDLPSLVRQMSRTHIGLSMSENESFGLAPLEMIAAGIPVVTTEVGVFQWHKDVLQARGAETIRPGDIESAARRIADRIDRKDFAARPDLRAYLSEAFSLPSYIERNESSYAEGDAPVPHTAPNRELSRQATTT